MTDDMDIGNDDDNDVFDPQPDYMALSPPSYWWQRVVTPKLEMEMTLRRMHKRDIELQNLVRAKEGLPLVADITYPTPELLPDLTSFAEVAELGRITIDDLCATLRDVCDHNFDSAIEEMVTPRPEQTGDHSEGHYFDALPAPEK